MKLSILNLSHRHHLINDQIGDSRNRKRLTGPRLPVCEKRADASRPDPRDQFLSNLMIEIISLGI